MITFLLKDINPNGSSFPNQIINIDNILYFVANDGITGEELWKSDGTNAGTFLIKDIDPEDTSVVENITNVNGTLFFTAHDGITGFELWKSDGTESGTKTHDLTLLFIDFKILVNQELICLLGKKNAKVLKKILLIL